MRRRSFLAGALIASALPSMGFSQNIIDYDSLSLRSDLYAQLARSGPFEEARGKTEIKLHREGVTVQVFVSPDAQSSRVLIFSHDIFAAPEVYLPLIRFLTTHGYCVIAPLHNDAIWRTRELLWSADLDERGYWDQRIRDCLIARNSYKTIANTIDVALDATYPVIIGHGAGALASQVVIGAQLNTTQGPLQLENDGWAGAISMTAPGPGILGFHEQSWQSVTTPRMVLATPQDQGLFQQTPEARVSSFYYSQGPYNHLAYLGLGRSTIYSGQTARPNTSQLTVFYDLRGSLNCFLQAYCGRDQNALSALYDGSLQKDSFGYVSLLSQ